MSKLVFIAFLLFASLAYGHEGSGLTPHAEELCGAPVPWEVTISNETLFVLAALLVLGTLMSLGGLARMLPYPSKYAGIVLVILVAVYYFVATPGYNPRYAAFGPVGSVHEHADFLVVINGAAINFSKPEYMSTLSSPKSTFTHLHEGEGRVAHKHAPRVPFSFLFETIGMKLTNNCFNDGKTEYCTDSTNKLVMTVNGVRISDIEKYSISDTDKIVVWYGPDNQSEIDSWEDKVSTLACIYSKKCYIPDGFVIPPENCYST